MLITAHILEALSAAYANTCTIEDRRVTKLNKPKADLSLLLVEHAIIQVEFLFLP